MQLKTLQTRLETADRESISIILNDQAMTAGANATADYIGLAIDNISSQKDRIKQAVLELREVQKSLEQQEDIIKVGVAVWLSENGIDKLQGDRISSITLFDKKESQEIIIDDEESVINAGYFKMTVDKTAAKQALQDGAQFEGAHIEITYNEQSIKLNKKRLKVSEDAITS
jgi:hypothetical protein